MKRLCKRDPGLLGLKRCYISLAYQILLDLDDDIIARGEEADSRTITNDPIAERLPWLIRVRQCTSLATEPPPYRTAVTLDIGQRMQDRERAST